MIPELPQRKALSEHREYHIVLRYMPTFMNVVDVMAEHRRVFDEKGQFCFGKIGKPAGRETINIINEQIHRGIETNIFFVSSKSKQVLGASNPYIYRTKAIILSRNYKHEFQAYVPDYYEKYDLKREIKLWIVMSELRSVDLHELYQYYIARTGTDLKHGLLYSSSGLFLVTRKQQKSSVRAD